MTQESLPILRLSTPGVSGGSKGCPGTRSGGIADSSRAGRSRRWADCLRPPTGCQVSIETDMAAGMMCLVRRGAGAHPGLRL